MSRSFMLLPLLSLALSAQGAKPAAKPAAKAAAKPAAPGKTKDAKADESPVLARIGGSVLTQADVDAFLENLPPQQRMQLQYTPGGMGRMVQELAELKLVAEKAHRLGLDHTPTYERRLQSIKTQLLTRAYLEKEDASLRAKGEVSDDEVKAYFEGHKDKFETPATYDARHILIGKHPQGAEKDRTDEEMQARVKEVMSAVAAGKPFEDLVESYTDDGGSKNTKGLYQAVRKGQFVPEFEKAALSQEIGKVGEPVKT
jgi:peptidyl-prolyl cis-trans isomerase C